MSQPIQLTVEQQFNIRTFSDKVKSLSHIEAQEFLVDLYEHMIKKESMYKHFLKKEWGMSTAPKLQ